MTTFPTIVLNGLTLGALFALVAVGYTMVYGVIKLINFAHGEFYMAGAFAGLLSLLWLCGPDRPLASWPGEAQLVLAVLLAGVAVALLASLVERLAYRPIRGGGRVSALLVVVGVSLLLQNGGIAVFGGRWLTFPGTVQEARYPRYAVDLDTLAPGEIQPRRVVYLAPMKDWRGLAVLAPNGRKVEQQVTLAEAGEPLDAAALARARAAEPVEVWAYPAFTVGRKQAIIFLALLLSAGVLYWLVQHTRPGRAMRAVSHDFETASLMGINVNRIVQFTFVLGGFCAGVGGVLAGGMYVGTAEPLMGFLFGLKAFIAAVLGGIGSIPGALVGGLVLGLVEQLAQYYADDLLFKGASDYRDAIAFIVLIAVLLLRPQGFFGRFEGEKV